MSIQSSVIKRGVVIVGLLISCILGCKEDSTTPTGPQAQYKIAYNTFRNGYLVIYTMNSDGTNQLPLTVDTTDSLYPEWSPDGTKILFSSGSSGNAGIYVMNSDGSNLQRLTTGVDYCPAWSRAKLP